MKFDTAGDVSEPLTPWSNTQQNSKRSFPVKSTINHCKQSPSAILCAAPTASCHRKRPSRAPAASSLSSETKARNKFHFSAHTSRPGKLHMPTHITRKVTAGPSLAEHCRGWAVCKLLKNTKELRVLRWHQKIFVIKFMSRSENQRRWQSGILFSSFCSLAVVARLSSSGNDFFYLSVFHKTFYCAPL